MRKFVCILLAAVMVLSLAWSAFAEISYDYDADSETLVVSTSNENGLTEITVTDAGSKAIGRGKNSATFHVPANGQTVTISAVPNGVLGGDSGTWTFKASKAGEPTPTDEPTVEPTVAPTVEPTVAPTVEPTVAPTVEPTVAPTVEPTVEPTVAPTVEPSDEPDGPFTVDADYKSGILTINVKNLPIKPAELWIDGVATGNSIPANGSYSFRINGLSAGTHTVTVNTIMGYQNAKFTVTINTPTLSADYSYGKITFTAGNLNGTTTVWLDRQGTGMTIPSDGTYTYNVVLTEGKHTLILNDSFNSVNSNPVTLDVGHEWDDWKVVKAPTCTEAGEEERVCKNDASHKETRTVDPAGHKPVKVEGTAPTCTEKGLSDGEKCSVCGIILTEQTEIDAIGHDWGDWKVTKEAKVGVKGEESRFCKNDESHVETREIEALSEDWDDGVVTKEPTCEEEGIRTHTSKNDPTLTKEVAIPALGHTPETIPAVEPTCTEKGLTEGEKCSVCDKILKEQEEVPALGHMYISQRAESLTRKKYICARCGDVMYMDANVAIENLYGSILRNALGEDVNYVAQMDANDSKVLVITATIDQNNPEWVSEIGMYLTKEIIASMRGEGFEYVKYVNEGAALVFALDDLKDELYATDEAINEYVITLDPRVEGGCLVSLDATVGENQKIPAQTFIPMKLDWNNKEIEVTAQGIYNE